MQYAWQLLSAPSPSHSHRHSKQPHLTGGRRRPVLLLLYLFFIPLAHEGESWSRGSLQAGGEYNKIVIGAGARDRDEDIGGEMLGVALLRTGSEKSS